MQLYLINFLQEVVDLTNPQCMIDGFLLHQVNEKKTTNNPILNDDSLISLIVDIFEAGREDFLVYNQYQYISNFIC